MAIDASKIYAKHPELWHDRLKEIVRQRRLRDELTAVKSKVCMTAAESRALNDFRGACMILAGAGMCNTGRILHHLRNSVWKPETSVIIVGYQCRNSPCRAMVEGAKLITHPGQEGGRLGFGSQSRRLQRSCGAERPSPVAYPDGQSAAENLAVLRRRPRPFAFGPIDSGAFSNPARNYPGTGKR